MLVLSLMLVKALLWSGAMSLGFLGQVVSHGDIHASLALVLTVTPVSNLSW
jgi:hypothetical protein